MKYITAHLEISIPSNKATSTTQMAHRRQLPTTWCYFFQPLVLRSFFEILLKWSMVWAFLALFGAPLSHQTYGSRKFHTHASSSNAFENYFHISFYANIPNVWHLIHPNKAGMLYIP